MGRDCICRLVVSVYHLDWLHLNSVSNETVDEFCDRSASELGMVKGVEAKLYVAEGAAPTFCQVRTVLYALRKAGGKEPAKLEAEGVISPTSYSDWAASSLSGAKKDSSVRICADYKVTINPWLEVEHHPLPRTQGQV